LSQYTYSIPSREDILGLFRTNNSALTAPAIAKALSVPNEAMIGLTRRLSAMERDGQIKPDQPGRYILCEQVGQFISGRVSAHRDGYGFLIPDNASPDIFLPEKEMQRVLHGDQVLVRPTGLDRRGRIEGAIVEILSRANTHVLGRLLQENGVYVVAPEDKRIGQDISVIGSIGEAKIGQIVSVELLEQPSRFTKPSGKIVEVLGELDDPGMEIEIAVRKFGVPHIFSDAALKQAAKLPAVVRAQDLEERVDLRDVAMVTIDGEDARDFDDAVYCEPMKIPGSGRGAAARARSNGFRLIVAIADVSHYVKPGDALDVDALERSTSVYFPRRVIPMLPEKLSNGLCSLNPALDRLTLVCDMVVTGEGEVIAYQFYPAVIHSKARLTYTEVAAILGNTKGSEAAKRPELVEHLSHLYQVFLALHKSRKTRGAIDFETTETYIVCNANGKIEKIIPRTRNDAHRLIEECMLAANVSAADLLIRHKHAGAFRVHAGPTVEKLNQLRTFLKQLGLNLGGGTSPQAQDYAVLMEQVKLRPDAALLQTMLLRSMQQAVYTPDNIGHFGLAFDAYCHFTSPIRRYPDLLTHRAIKAILQGKVYEPKGIKVSSLNSTISNAARKQQAKDKAAGTQKREQDHTIWDALGIHCSANERRADEASRDVEAWLKCYFIRDKLGEEFSGTISGVTSFGIFVQLDTLYIEGLVHVTDLGADFFQFDDARHELRGERTGRRFQLTDRVTVQVSRVDLEARKIDLRLVEPNQLLQNKVVPRKENPAVLDDYPLPAKHKQRAVAEVKRVGERSGERGNERSAGKKPAGKKNGRSGTKASAPVRSKKRK
jgi:ribonuclease R